ncbi:hypothetical protein NDU88_010693 [Pleurodeles waltl]|uniref:Uncharacterized protein n=1 Tax=Pleurodeles waltl TaxID=8319 RepID=A0AAV7QZI8_PLEWA|nr:hypothetical protein NDU88_010693 [Pleurodeles waltl]
MQGRRRSTEGELAVGSAAPGGLREGGLVVLICHKSVSRSGAGGLGHSQERRRSGSASVAIRGGGVQRARGNDLEQVRQRALPPRRQLSGHCGVNKERHQSRWSVDWTLCFYYYSSLA